MTRRRRTPVTALLAAAALGLALVSDNLVVTASVHADPTGITTLAGRVTAPGDLANVAVWAYRVNEDTLQGNRWDETAHVVGGVNPDTGRYTVAVPSGGLWICYATSLDGVYATTWTGGETARWPAWSALAPHAVRAEASTVQAGDIAMSVPAHTTIQGRVQLGDALVSAVTVQAWAGEADQLADGRDSWDGGTAQTVPVDPATGRYSIEVDSGDLYAISAKSLYYANTFVGGLTSPTPVLAAVRPDLIRAAGGTVEAGPIALTEEAGAVAIPGNAAYDTKVTLTAATGGGATYQCQARAGQPTIVCGGLPPHAYMAVATFTSNADASTRTDITLTTVRAEQATDLQVMPRYAFTGGVNLALADATTRVAGQVRVGRTVVAETTLPAGRGAGATMTYYWTDGQTVFDTGPRFAPVTAESGDPLFVITVITSPTGYACHRAALGAVEPGGLTLTQTTTVNGRVVRVRGVPKGWKATVTWYRAGKAVRGASGVKRLVKKADVGKKLSASVTLVRRGTAAVAVRARAVKAGKIVPAVDVWATRTGRAVRVHVAVASYGRPTGTVEVRFGHAGVRRVRLSASNKGTMTVAAPAGFKRGRVTARFTSGLSRKYVSAKTVAAHATVTR
ncbi:MAG: hypothetical protein LBM66_08140 [Bifidobacteriaceae bacterium]|jgi:hypothetical protein|nr:hypothetical protein [Bifidobacteriaceae bacterium]